MGNVLKRLRAWWINRLRRIDREILWPICKEKAEGDLVLAKKLFAVHMSMDYIWAGLSEAEFSQIMDSLV